MLDSYLIYAVVFALAASP